MFEIIQLLFNDEECKRIFFYKFDDGRKREAQKILETRVPLLRLSPMNFKLDMQFDMTEAIRNSVFVRSCVMLDERVAYLHYWLSNLFRLCGIKGSQKGLFSSYHSLSLVIHFMQYQKHLDMKPVLPVMLKFDPLLKPSSSLHNVIKKLDENVCLFSHF
uniref:Uncharacterized protein n=1 Tax=Acrobeloides nanus TaxID=290746 RepID=A0A914DEG7_9BILA